MLNRIRQIMAEKSGGYTQVPTAEMKLLEQKVTSLAERTFADQQREEEILGAAKSPRSRQQGEGLDKAAK